MSSRRTLQTSFLALLALALLPTATGDPPEGDGLCSGILEGSYDGPVSVGFPESSWDPHALPLDDAHLSVLETLRIRLSWTNEPAGAADFGIAVGTPPSYRYWNQEYQTGLGAHAEEQSWERHDIEEWGWDGAQALSVGPSISTGAYAGTPIDYRIEWDVTFRGPGDTPCHEPEPQATTVKGGDGADGIWMVFQADPEDPLDGRLPVLLGLAVIAGLAAALAASHHHRDKQERQ